jgi:hypothetical protein
VVGFAIWILTGHSCFKRGDSGARLELIKKVASLSLEGLTTSEIAKELNTSYSKVRRMLLATENLPAICLSETA